MIVDFAVPAYHRVELKEYEKMDQNLDLAWVLETQWDVWVTIIPIVIFILGTVSKGLVKRLEDCEITARVETVQTTALLRSVRILRRRLEKREDLLSRKLQSNTIS